jgi:hypothetical protein
MSLPWPPVVGTVACCPHSLQPSTAQDFFRDSGGEVTIHGGKDGIRRDRAGVSFASDLTEHTILYGPGLNPDRTDPRGSAGISLCSPRGRG